MTSMQNEYLRAAFAPARAIEPTAAEISAVVERAGRSPQRRGARRLRWPRLAVAVVAATVLVGAAGYAAAPPLRAAIDDLAGSFAGWAGGDSSQAPGRPLGREEHAPGYFHDRASTTDPRVIAEAGGYKLYAAREPGSDTMQFDLGDTGVAVGGIAAESFRNRALLVLGPGSVQHADEHGHVPLFGVTARAVTTVELTYRDGPPLRVAGIDGGFVLLAEPDRSPVAVIARDAQGDELGRSLVDDSDHEGSRIDWDAYGPPASRVPSRCLPGAAGVDPPSGCPNG